MTDEVLATLVAKVMVLESAVALLLAGSLGRHSDPLGALSAFESAIDRRASEVAASLPPFHQEAQKAASETIRVLIREGQAALDEIEKDRAKGRPKPE